MNKAVDQYLLQGCGRCAYFNTPRCKVHTWHDLLLELRRIVLDTELSEDYKWSQPCYTWNGKNVLMISAFKDYASLSFFKGALLKDPAQLLTAPGSNSQASRQFRFTDIEQLIAREDQIRKWVADAISIEKQGQKIEFTRQEPELPQELLERLEADEQLNRAWQQLTPGRRRGYVLHFSQAKQSGTRQARIDKYSPAILAGKGMHDR